MDGAGVAALGEVAGQREVPGAPRAADLAFPPDWLRRTASQPPGLQRGPVHRGPRDRV